MTSSLRPEASVAASSVRAISSRISALGSSAPAGRLADDAAGPDEAGERVDMAVGVVVQQAVVEPDDLARAEGLAQRGFGLRLGPAIAIGVEQGLRAW